MSNDIQAPETASQEVQDVFKELESEGFEISGREPKAEEPKAPETPKEPEKKEEQPKEPEESPEVENESVEEEKKPAKTERTPRSVPVVKYNEERHKRQDAESRAIAAEKEAQELRAKLNVLPEKPTEAQLDDVKETAKELAEKHGLDESLANDLANSIAKIASKRAVLPKEINEQIEALKQANQQLERERLEKSQEVAFENEFDSILKEFPDLADQKKEIKELAFSEENINTSLRRIALEYLHDNPKKAGRKTAESPTPKRNSENSESIDFSSLTDDQIDAMSGAQLDAYIEWAKGKK